jgi:hypothetical protein
MVADAEAPKESWAVTEMVFTPWSAGMDDMIGPVMSPKYVDVDVMDEMLPVEVTR